MLAWIQQYLAYVIIGLLIALAASNATWYGVCWYKNQRIDTLTAQVKEKEAQLSQRDALIEGFALKTAEVAQKVTDANRKAAESQSKHQKEIQDLVSEKFPIECQEAADYAVSRMPKVLPEGWR